MPRTPLEFRPEPLELRQLLSVISSFSAGFLRAASDSNDGLTIDCAAGHVHVNGFDPSNGPADCSQIVRIFAGGGPASNRIDLAGVTLAAFPLVTAVAIQGGTGDDTVIGSDFADSIVGGAGNDDIDGGPGSDSIDGDGDSFAGLYVSDFGNDQVLRFSDETGSFVGLFVDPPHGLAAPQDLAVGPDGNLYIASAASRTILRFDPVTGDAMPGVFGTLGSAEFVTADSALNGGLVTPTGLTFDDAGNLYVCDGSTGVVSRFDTFGFWIDSFAATAESVSCNDLVFGPDGNLYVTSNDTSSVIRYHGLTGAFIDYFVQPHSGGLTEPVGLAFGRDGNLYVASGAGIARFDGHTGAFIDSFVSNGSGGLSAAAYFVFEDDGNLLVSSEASDSVLRFDGLTGSFTGVVVSAGAGRVSGPRGLALTNTELYVASANTNSVIHFASDTGSFINAVVAGDVDRLVGAGGLAFSGDGNLVVSSILTSTLLRFDRNTGTFLDELVAPHEGGIDLPRFVTIGPDERIYVAGFRSNSVARFDANGVFIDLFVGPGSGGLDGPNDLEFGPDGNLYVASERTNSVLRFDGVSGVPLPGPNGAVGTAEFVPRSTGNLAAPVGVAFGPDGNLYVSSRAADAVLRFDAVTGAPLGPFIRPRSGSLIEPLGITFGPDGLLYVASFGTNSVLRFDANTGEFVDTITDLALNSPLDIAFVRSGNDSLSGGAGADTLVGGFGGDVLEGGAGDDLIDGGPGRDTFRFAGALLGRDTLVESAAVESDLLDFSAVSADVSIDLTQSGAQSVLAAGNLTLVIATPDRFEDVFGGSGNDTLLGNSRPNRFDGGPGDDHLEGRDGNDQYQFGPGPALGSDTVVEAAEGDIDTLDFTDCDFAVTVDLNTTALQAVSPGGLSLTISDASAIENVIGTAFGDRIGGNAADNSLFGGAGPDTLLGLDGRDSIDGGFGDDSLEGGTGDDQYRFGRGGDLGSDRIVETPDADHDGLDFSNIAAPISINLASTSVQSISAGLVAIQLSDGNGVEDVQGTRFSDQIIGNDRDNLLAGGNGGGDTLVGVAGDDTLMLGDPRFGFDFDFAETEVDGGTGSDRLEIDDRNSTAFGIGHLDYLIEADRIVRAGLEIRYSAVDFVQLTASDVPFSDTVRIMSTASSTPISVFAANGPTVIIGSALHTVNGVMSEVSVAAIQFGTLQFDDASDSRSNRVTIAFDSVGAGDGLVPDTYFGVGGTVFYSGFDRVDLLTGAGDDIINAVAGAGGRLLVDAGAGADEILGSFGSETIITGLGDARPDTVLCGGGSDALFTGAEDELSDDCGRSLRFSSADQSRLRLVLPGRKFESRESIDLIVAGTVVDDTIVTGRGNDFIVALEGNDIIESGVGNDTVLAGSGFDTIRSGDGNDALFGGPGNDRIEAASGDDFVEGSSDFDTLDGGTGDDVLVDLLGGDDQLAGGAGNDSLVGGPGNDVERGDAGNDLIVDHMLLKFNFSVQSTALEAALLAVGSFDDGLALPSDDTMDGGTGDDTINGGPGNDSLSGGPGNDLILDYHVELQVGSAGRELAPFNCPIFANRCSIAQPRRDLGGDDVLSGDAGDDTLVGGAGSDELIGGDGDDVLVGSIPADERSLVRPDQASLGDEQDTLDGGPGRDILANLTNAPRGRRHALGGQMRSDATDVVIAQLDRRGMLKFLAVRPRVIGTSVRETQVIRAGRATVRDTVERFTGGLGRFLQEIGVNPTSQSKGRVLRPVPRETRVTLTVPTDFALDQLLQSIIEGS